MNNQLNNLLTKLKMMRPFLPYLFAAVMIGLFAYTGLAVNAAFNPAPQIDGSLDKGKVNFDQATIKAVESLNGNTGAVQGVSTSSDGTNPFGAR